MAIWARFKRLMRSIFGGAISAMENPKLVLEQNIRDLNDQVPKMNETIAQVKAAEIRSERALKHAKGREAALTSRIKAALRSGNRDAARNWALQLEKARSEVQQITAQLQQAKQAYAKAQQVKEVFMRDRQRKIDEAQHALRAHERAKMQSKVAGVLEQFEVAGVDQTHDEMISRIEEDTARNEARMEVALDSVDTETLRLEQDAESWHADELVRQFEMEMKQETLGDPTASVDPESTPTEKSMGLDSQGTQPTPLRRAR